MTEQAARALAAVLAGDPVRLMPSARTWGVILEQPNGEIVSLEDSAGFVYRHRQAFDAWQAKGDDSGVVRSAEWTEWDGCNEWAVGLATVLGSDRYWHSGGNIWLVFFDRADGRFVVIGSESGGVYANYQEFDADM